MSAELPVLPQLVARPLPEVLNRREVPLSWGRRLIVKRERHTWVVGFYAAQRKSQGWDGYRMEWGWRTGEAGTLSLALERAGVERGEGRQIETYLLDVAYRSELCT